MIELINKYRPKTFDDVIGQDEVVEAFHAALAKNRSRSFILAGPSGTGKTTLARIGAEFIGSVGGNTIEVAAAITNGVDDMRALCTGLAYRPLSFSGKAAKAIIVDEAHRITSAGFDAVLKEVEEPPEWGYWFFCTTDIDKLPKTIKTRCSIYRLKQIDTNAIYDYLEKIVVRLEDWDTPKSVLQLCAARAEGSMRKALSFLSVCSDVRDREQAVRLILAEEGKLDVNGFAIAQALSKGVSWPAMQPLLYRLVTGNRDEDEEGNKLEDDVRKPRETAEGVRHTIRGYFTTVAVNAKDSRTACEALRILDLFSEPCREADGFTPIVLAVGRALLARKVEPSE